jgi:hypothetical protein
MEMRKETIKTEGYKFLLDAFHFVGIIIPTDKGLYLTTVKRYIQVYTYIHIDSGGKERKRLRSELDSTASYIEKICK